MINRYLQNSINSAHLILTMILPPTKNLSYSSLSNTTTKNGGMGI